MSDNSGPQPVDLRKVLIKALFLFTVFNIVYYVVQPLALLNRLTVYNLLVPGRLRLPFGEYPADSYNVTVASIDQMVASHVLARPKLPDEFRVVHIGDSSVWGYLLPPEATQAECINRLGLRLPDGRALRMYNLGYPKLTVMKDLLILRRALRYQPDLIVWSTSLASLYPTDQLGSPASFPIIWAHRDEVAALIAEHGFTFYEWALTPPPAWTEHTFFGQRRQLADWLRHQLYGLAWASTHIDHAVPKFVTPHPVNLIPDENILSVNVMSFAEPGRVSVRDISLDVMKAGIDEAAAQGVPTLVVNEPIYRSERSPLRYNEYYPRWAFDTYRDALRTYAAAQGWRYADLWDAAPNDQFTDTAFHLNADASCAYAAVLAELLVPKP